MATKEEILKMEKAKANRFAVNNPDIDLTAGVTLNKNPYLIPAGTNISGWSYFQQYLKKLYKDNPEKLTELNTNEGFKVSQQIINNFNQNYFITIGDSYDIHVGGLSGGKPTRKTITRKNVASFKFLDRFPNGLIDDATVRAAQNYHLLTSFSGSNRVLVDGWVGSQTSQLVYPQRNLYYLAASNGTDLNGKPLGILTKDGIVSSRPEYTEGLIPAIWGNQKFVIDAKIVDQYVNDVETGALTLPIPGKIGGNPGTALIPFEYFIPYNESIHNSSLQFLNQGRFGGAPTPAGWYTVGFEPIPYKDSTKTNNIIKEQQLKNQKLRSETIIKQNITSSGEDLKKQNLLKENAKKDALVRSNELAKLYGKK